MINITNIIIQYSNIFFGQPQDQLYDVRQVVAAESAFCALRWDGRGVTWGRGDIGGESDAVQSQLRAVAQPWC